MLQITISEYITKILLYYLLLINTVTFLIFGLDKMLAKSNSRRMPEKFLFLLALLGGALGAMLGMEIWHHKRKKTGFYLKMVVILLGWMVLYLIINYQFSILKQFSMF